MTASISDVFVWAWLPGEAHPVPAGVLRPGPSGLNFRYGKGYLARGNAIDLYGLPRDEKWHPPRNLLPMPSSLRDSAPDAWGMRVILDRMLGSRGAADVDALGQSVYLLESASDRIGAVDFQATPDEYIPRGSDSTIGQMQRAACALDEKHELTPELHAALMSGTGIGGARPKATLVDGARSLVAKFSTGTDTFPVVSGEAASIELARHAGIRVPSSKVVRVGGRDVLLTERFDRDPPGARRMIVTALTMLDLGEMEARYGNYVDLVRVLGGHGAGADVGREIFQRVAFNIAISNTDDHLRNHAAFWDGERLELTPAYDLSPMPRSGETANQAIAYSVYGARASNFAELVAVADEYGLSRREGKAVVDGIIDAIHRHWDEAADASHLSGTERARLWGRQILNPAASYGLSPNRTTAR